MRTEQKSPTPKQGLRVLNADEVSELLRIPKSTLYKLCSEGKIPVVKVGRHWRFDRARVEEWFHRGSTAPSSEAPKPDE